MAFTREFLKACGLTDEQVSSVMQEHVSVTDALKAQREDAKKEAENAKKEAAKVPGLQQEIDSLKGGEDFKAKYEKEHADFEAYKGEISAQEQKKKVETAYRKLLADEHIKTDRHDFIIAHTDLSKATLDKDGNLVEAEALKKEINDSVNGWGAFKVAVEKESHHPATPPKDGNTGTGVSRAKELAQKYQADRYGVKDTGKE